MLSSDAGKKTKNKNKRPPTKKDKRNKFRLRAQRAKKSAWLHHGTLKENCRCQQKGGNKKNWERTNHRAPYYVHTHQLMIVKPRLVSRPLGQSHSESVRLLPSAEKKINKKHEDTCDGLTRITREKENKTKETRKTRGDWCVIRVDAYHVFRRGNMTWSCGVTWLHCVFFFKREKKTCHCVLDKSIYNQGIKKIKPIRLSGVLNCLV